MELLACDNLTHDTEDKAILLRANLAFEILRRSYERWRSLLEDAKLSAKENLLFVDFQRMTVDTKVVQDHEFAADSDGLTISNTDMYEHFHHVWSLHTHVLSGKHHLIKACEEFTSKSCGSVEHALYSIPSGTDVASCVRATITYTKRYKKFTPVVEGVLSKDGVIFMWPSRSFIERLMRKRESKKMYDNLQNDVNEIVLQAHASLNNHSRSREQRIKSLLEAMQMLNGCNFNIVFYPWSELRKR